MSKGVIHWFRKGLRLHDNPALQAAIDTKLKLYPVFVLDPWFVKNGRVGINRWRFLEQSLQDLDQELRKLGTRLFVLRGTPEKMFTEVFAKWDVMKMTYEVDTEPYSKERDASIGQLAKKLNVQVDAFVSHTLYDVNEIIKKNKGSPPLTYQKLTTLVKALGPPRKALPRISSIPTHSLLKKELLSAIKYNVPSLKELNVKETDLNECFYPGGETEGLKRIDKYICESNKKWVACFEKPKTSPNSLEPSTTVLSPYLKFGCVSVRMFYERLDDVYKKVSNHSQPPVSLYGQLLWREFFYTCGSAVEKFDQMEGNSICRQIDWDVNEDYLSAWRDGRTGYPYIDAIMTQLRTEGWIHHLARHSVACFLTRGDLYISWEEGMKVFDQYLLDADWSLNAANWMWLSASAFFHQYFRVYSPIAFGKKTDPRGLYIKKYLPVLEKIPEKYIYEPWDAPLDVQKRAGCIIGKDYPRRIVDHSTISKVNIGRMKAAYDLGKQQKAGESSGETSKKRKSESENTIKGENSKRRKSESFVGESSKKSTIDSESKKRKKAASSKKVTDFFKQK